MELKFLSNVEVIPRSHCCTRDFKSYATSPQRWY